MNTTLRPLYFILLGILLLPSCGLFKKKKKEVPRNPNIRLSGRVQSVNKHDKFVLIRRYGSWKVGEGQVVESRGDGRSANLIPTGEKLGEHVAADIRSGNVEVGDAVYIRQIIKPTKDAPVTPSVPSSDTPVVKSPPVAPLPLPPQPVPVAPKPSPKPDIPQVPEDQL